MSIKSETQQDISEKVVYVGRCAKVVKGGRRFSFLVLVVAGDGKGRVGIGLGKAPEVIDARTKAVRVAKKNMAKIKIPLREGRTLHHDVTSYFCSGKMILRAAPAGTGVIAGGPVRSMLEMVGIKDVVAKSVGSNNPHNMLKAALKALQSISSPRQIAEKRGLKIAEIVARRDGVTSSNAEL